MGDLAKLAVQLTPVESLRAVVLLEEALKQFAFLGRLAKDPKTIKCSQICASSGDDIVRILGEQQELGQIHQRLSEEKEQLKGLRDREQYTEVAAKLDEVSLKLKEANRDLCRSLRQTPNVQANVMKLDRERQRMEEWLTETLNELKQSNTFKCLLDNVAQEKHAQERLAEAKRRNREVGQAVRLLEAELRKEAAEYAESRRASSLEIASLKEELQRLRAKASVKLAFQEKLLTAQCEGTEWLHRQEEKQQEEELAQMQQEADLEAFLYSTTADFSSAKIKQLQAEREKQHLLHQKLNAEKQQELTQLLKRQNSISRALGIAQSRIEEEEKLAREAAAAEQLQAWTALQRSKQKDQEQQAALVLQHFARTFLQGVQEAEKKGKAGKKKGQSKKK